jgi:GGDEF domain-containing protein
MADSVVSALARLCAHRFASLGDAVGSVLSLLEQQLPPGRVIFAELNYATDEYRVLDARGDGGVTLAAGACLPLAESFCVHMANDDAPPLTGHASKQPVYRGLDLRKSGHVQSYVAAPVELADGTRVASVCAMSPEPQHYGESERALLTIAARLIADQWERVNRERELRRLNQQQRALTGDPLTGLPLRETFLEHLMREWQLTQRGITESYLVAIKPLRIEDARATSGDAVADLLLQSTAEVISACIRRTDIAGRVAEDVFGMVLVGCKGMDGVEAFRLRLEGAFERKLSHRPEKLELGWGVERLGDADSAEDALKRVEGTIGDNPVAHAGSER